MSSPKNNNKNSTTTGSLVVPPRDRVKKFPFILCILDGWGIYKDYNGNAISQAKAPNFALLWKNYPHTQLQASGKYVGLPLSQDGNSEAGHLNLGAGRIIEQDTIVVSRAIEDGTFFKNPAFIASIKHIEKTKGDIHLMGLLTGWQSAHADPNHIVALLKFYRQHKIKNIYLHLFTDGRDSFKFGALKFLEHLKKQLKSNEEIASIAGRYYAMDRKNKWNRIEKVYNSLVLGKSEFLARTPEEAIQQAYDRGETDEFILPTVIVKNGKHNAKGICVKGDPIATIKDGDAIVFFNLRSDRARELTKTFVQKDFDKKIISRFKRHKIVKDIVFIAMTDFGPDLDSILSAFPSQDITKTLPMTLSDLKQLYIAETEKYAHMTYFFNGGYAHPVGNEDRKVIDSPDVSSYDLKPEMSAFKITSEILKDLKNNKHDFIAVNFANPDMVGHTGNLAAGIQAVEAVDKCLGKIYNEIKNKNGVLLIVSDHGNIEEMINEKTGEIDTQHSSFPVPFILIDKRLGSRSKNYNLKQDGILANVAPTILDLINKKIPKEMTSKSLIIQ